MVKLNSSTKMMVNRCMELLNAKIAKAQTRHIARRIPLTYKRPRTVDIKAIQREREKVEKYEASKRLSMWEQNRNQNDTSSENPRMDHSYYKPCGVYDRNYDTTWVNFPEKTRPKQSKRWRLEERAPVRRRNDTYHPDTARPFDSEATDFLKQWDNNSVMVYRNRYATPENVLEPSMGIVKHPRRRVF